MAVLVTVAGLSACATFARTEVPPTWFVSTPSDTASDLWGAGEGPDPDSATRAALRQIAGRLRVSVSGVTDSTVMVSQQSVYRTDQTRVQEIVRETEFTGVSVNQSVRHSGGVYALVRVDRRAFVRETVARFNDHYSRVQQKLQAAELADALGRYRLLRAALPDAEQAYGVGQLLRVLDASATDSAAMNITGSIRQRLADSAAKLTVRIDHSPADADVASLVSQWLGQAGFQRVQSGSALAVLSLRVDSRTQAVFDTWNCRLSVNMNWTDSTGGAVAVKAHEVNGSSLESLQQARQNAIRRWAQGAQTNDPSSNLGLSQ